MATAFQRGFDYVYRKLNFGLQVQSVKRHFVDWRMMKDFYKRVEVKKGGAQRLRINAIRKNKILPPELRELADAEIKALPVNTSITRLVGRCILTSKPRGVVNPYKLSRIAFRDLADYNKLAGVQRARW